MKKEKYILLILGIILIFSGCGKTGSEEKNTGKLIIRFEHQVDGQPLITDTLRYVNAAGNRYEISEIQWFASDITLYKKDGSVVLLDPESFAHYIDTDIPESNVWEIKQPVPAGQYEAVSFTFGIKGKKNTPFMFTDPPESDMIWPINLGGEMGGYHYMKMNGFWVDKDGVRSPFNFHLGVGQQRDKDGKITGFIQNWFETKLKDSAFELKAGEKKEIAIVMNIENWFNNPHIYDHNLHGGKIMQNQEAMNMGKENGEADVFSLGLIKTLD
jgi:hypothetical protein